MSAEDRIFRWILAVVAVGCVTALAIPEHFERVAGLAVSFLLLACAVFLTGYYLMQASKKDTASNLAGAVFSAIGAAFVTYVLTK